MYSTCLFCKSGLGSNEVIEHFPVGRRLAFDAAKGQLWVVCRSCERWNLSPLEERWEAIEGELRYLERAWREAEEIAAIADRLGQPAKVEEFIRQHRAHDDQDKSPRRTSS